jgi:tRNA-2-methylthio-N6-dimethylallyladenosine synthase
MGPQRRSFFIETFGCQMNKAESGALEKQLIDSGWDLAADSADADLVILNTCSVRKTAENRIYGRIGFYKHLKTLKNFKLAVIGCMSERLKDQLFKERSEIDILIGSFQKHRLVDIIDEAIETDRRFLLTEQEDFRFAPQYSHMGFKAYVPIMHGCDNYCTYCVVPYVRGREVSRDPAGILKEINTLEDQKVREITLLGQNVNSYRYEAREGVLDFPALLELIVVRVANIKWVRFLTSHPKDLSGELIRVIRDNPALCRHIHLPVQHGSNRILRAMGRGYTRERYLLLVEEIKSSITDVALTTDILIGFPGEEMEDFEQTIDLMETVRFDDAFMYRYNPREGTKAYEMGDTVPEEKKIERLSQIIELQREISRQKRKERLGRSILTLAESRSKKSNEQLLGRTEWDEMVVFPGRFDKIGSLVEVELVSLNGTTFVGEEKK